MTEFVVEQILLLPFLFVAYLAMEWVERHAGDSVVGMLMRGRLFGPVGGPFAGAFAGLVPQCGFSAAAASLYSGGLISVGTLVAVFLATSDELVPVLLSKRVPASFVGDLLGLKILFALVAGLFVNFVAGLFGACNGGERAVRVGNMCLRSRCGCWHRKGILVPALIHTVETFAFLFAVSCALEAVLHFFGGEEMLRGCVLNRPLVGEAVGGLVGLVPNCAASAACAGLYAEGGMSAGALVASSLTGSGVGMLVLFRTNRNLAQNVMILVSTYALGVLLGWAGGCFIS